MWFHVYAGDTSLPAAWKGVRRTAKLCCDEQASAFFVEERLQSVATELIQAAWRRRKASKLAAVGASVGRHWNLSEGMQSVHGPDAEELPLTLKTLFVSLGTAAKIIIRWWRRRRRTLWSKAANVIRNAWKWNRHRYHQVSRYSWALYSQCYQKRYSWCLLSLSVYVSCCVHL